MPLINTLEILWKEDREISALRKNPRLLVN